MRSSRISEASILDTLTVPAPPEAWNLRPPPLDPPGPSLDMPAPCIKCAEVDRLQRSKRGENEKQHNRNGKPVKQENEVAIEW